MQVKILGVSGSMREGSFSNRALEAVLEAAEEHGGEVRLLDLRVTDLPMYNPDAPVKPESIAAANSAVAWADALILATPDYHGSMSGAMKNFLDYHWKAFAGKLFGCICASHERGITAMDQMRTAIRQCYGWTLPYGLAIHGEKDLDSDGLIQNPALERRIKMFGRDMVAYGGLLRRQFETDLVDAAPDTFAARYR